MLAETAATIGALSASGSASNGGDGTLVFTCSAATAPTESEWNTFSDWTYEESGSESGSADPAVGPSWSSWV